MGFSFGLFAKFSAMVYALSWPFAYCFPQFKDIKVFTESNIFFNIFRVIKLPIGKMICNFSNSLFILLKFVPKNSTSIATALGSIVYFYLLICVLSNLQLDSHILAFEHQAVLPNTLVNFFVYLMFCTCNKSLKR
jgi:hypothetical protein